MSSIDEIVARMRDAGALQMAPLAAALRPAWSAPPGPHAVALLGWAEALVAADRRAFVGGAIAGIDRLLPEWDRLTAAPEGDFVHHLRNVSQGFEPEPRAQMAAARAWCTADEPIAERLSSEAFQDPDWLEPVEFGYMQGQPWPWIITASECILGFCRFGKADYWVPRIAGAQVRAWMAVGRTPEEAARETLRAWAAGASTGTA